MDAQSNLIFQKYLTEAKAESLKKLNNKIHPATKLEDYTFLRILGQGNYGTVVAAQNIHNNQEYAIKIFRKKKIVGESHLKHIISEVRILNAISFNFTISLECYFTSKCHIFIVLPPITGGHFFKFLRKVKRFDENSARFFAGQVVLTIEYLHFLGIVYRDLKPENLLLDLNGYLKFVDFGFSKIINNGFTYTFCGTPEYIAPEILLNKGYSKSIDWWSFGILLFEMCHGKPPFTASTDLRLYEKILAGQVNWPEHFSMHLKSLTNGLLQVDKTKRLGCMRNKVEDIKYHDWFSNFDWVALWNRKIIPPITYIPPKNYGTNDLTPENFSFTKPQGHCPSDYIGNIDFAI